MNKKQWHTLGVTFWILGLIFIYMDLSHGFIITSDPCNSNLRINNVLDENDIICTVRGEIYSPFIWLFVALAIISHIMARIE